MEVKIGIRNVVREVVIESDQDEQTITALVEKATNGEPLRLTDRNGNTVIVPSDALGYVEIGANTKGRVGFGA